jgi:nucleoside-diphosphate-sugar epimerase
MSNQFPQKYKIADVRVVEKLRTTITGDVVVNFAAVHREAWNDNSEYQRTNLDGIENVSLIFEEKGINHLLSCVQP